MTALAPIAFTSDSARVVGEVYGTSIIVTVPLLGALLAGLFLRNAGMRLLVWRCTLVAIVGILVGRFAPLQWNAWLLPDPLAWPLLQVGTLQLSSAAGDTGASPSALLLQSAFVAWILGVAIVLLPVIVGRLRLHRAGLVALPLDSRQWRQRVHLACERVGVRPDAVLLVSSPSVSVPMTWGTFRHVIMLPPVARRWPAGRVEAVLLHELAHVKGRDATALLVMRLVCAVLWFHPGVWWLSRRLAFDAERACDDSVLAAGVRRSDYAEWLAASASGGADFALPAMSLAGRGLRERLAAIVDITRRIELPSRRAVACALMLTGVVVAPLSTVRIAPTRDFLTALMDDARWESRAWAVVRLAERPDSVDVARGAARHDPDPAVRAWARYALGLTSVMPGPAPRS